MVAYQKDEIVSASNIARGFANVLSSITSGAKDKIAISKNNKLEAVIVGIDQYEAMREALEILEHQDIYRAVKEREASDNNISLEDAMKLHGIDIDDV
jgi:PHD/YefM family antitoxin component YafN of YafNO toxin-antitoxin module